jgi:hypothetical protein
MCLRGRFRKKGRRDVLQSNWAIIGCACKGLKARQPAGRRVPEADKRYTQCVGHSKKEHTKAPQASTPGGSGELTNTHISWWATHVSYMRAAHRVQTQPACTGGTECKTQLHRREHTPGGVPQERATGWPLTLTPAAPPRAALRARCPIADQTPTPI